MSSWFAIAVPYLPDLINLARPLFTRDKNKEKSPDILAQQISELQSAVTENVESINKLAAETQKTLQLGADALEKKLRVANIINIVAITMATLAFCLAAYALTQ